MLWVTLATSFVVGIAASPMLYAIYLHGVGSYFDLYRYTPQQFIFLTVPIIVGAYCSFLGLRLALRNARATDANDPFLIWITNNWPFAMLVGVVLVSIVTIADYFSSAKAPPTMEPIYAEKTLKAAQHLRDELERAAVPSRIDADRQAMVTRTREEFRSIIAAGELPPDKFLSLRPATFIRLVMNSSVQRNWGVLNETMHALTIAQLFFVLIAAFTLLLAIGVTYLTVRASPDLPLDDTMRVLQYGIVAFAIYPICYRYYVAEFQLITEFSSTTRGDVLSMLLILGVTALFISMDPSTKSFFTAAVRGFPLLLVAGSSVYVTLQGALSLRQIVGIEMTFGTWVILEVIMLLFLFFVILSTWPRPGAAQV